MSHSRLLSRLAVAFALVACAALGACGRKGPLDPPPDASVAGQPQAQAAPQPGNFSGLAGLKGQKATPRDYTPSRKTIPLDVLLN